MSTSSSSPPTPNIYLDDTLQTFLFQKQALEIKLKHNLAELSTKNAYLSTILKQLCIKQQEIVRGDCETIKDVIRVCRSMEDDLTGLDILQKKTDILKAQVLAIAYRLNQWKNREEGVKEGVKDAKETKDNKDRQKKQAIRQQKQPQTSNLSALASTIASILSPGPEPTNTQGMVYYMQKPKQEQKQQNKQEQGQKQKQQEVEKEIQSGNIQAQKKQLEVELKPQGSKQQEKNKEHVQQ